MNTSIKIGLVKVVTLFSILLALLSGMVAIASADDVPQSTNMFYGAVTLNDANASSGTVINAYIDEKLHGSVVIDAEGMYYDLGVESNESDDGETITFTVCGATAGTAVWHASTTPTSQELNLTAVDDEAPAVTDANATPSTIVADGVETTQLNVTVIDGCGVGNVTVNLSAIGGSEAQEMSRIGDTDVYTVTVTAAEDTAPGAYCLCVNASDVFGNYNTSVCIGLNVTMPGLPQTGDIDGSEGDPTMSDAVYLAKHVVGLSGYDTIYADGDIDGSEGDPTMSDAVYLAKHVVGLSGYETIY
jgi:hypothetical protein